MGFRVGKDGAQRQTLEREGEENVNTQDPLRDDKYRGNILELPRRRLFEKINTNKGGDKKMDLFN